MTSPHAAVPRSSPLQRALFRLAAWMRRAAPTRPRATVVHRVDEHTFAELSDHLLRDIGLVREPFVRPYPTFPFVCKQWSRP